MSARRPHLFAWTAIALLLGAMGCGRGCTCISGEKSFEHLDGKVKVELVRKTHWAGGKIPGPISDFVVRIHTDPPFDEEVQCQKVELAEDEAGTNVGFRCDKTAEWTVIRLRGKDRHIRECTPGVGTGPKPKFDALRKLSDIAPELLDCAQAERMSSHGVRSAEIVTSVREEAGSAAATAVVVNAVHRPGAFADFDSYDAWGYMLDALTVAERATALAKVCDGLLHADTPPTAYLQAVRWCSLDDANRIGDVALARLEERLRGTAEQRSPLELQWVAALATRARPLQAGKAACASQHDLRDFERGLLMALVARARIACPAVLPALKPPPCGEELDCDGGLCSAAELTSEMDTWAQNVVTERGDAGTRKLELVPHDRLRTLLAAAYAQGPLPREILLPNARRHYAQADAGPECDDETLAEGAPCQCETITDQKRCTIAPDEKRFPHGACDVRIDDAKRRFDARHLCAHDGSPCGYGAPCCPGLACARHDGGPLQCEPARDAGDGG